jgi:hypothetical protein
LTKTKLMRYCKIKRLRNELCGVRSSIWTSSVAKQEGKLKIDMWILQTAASGF